MVRGPDTPCAGGCGALLWSSTKSLPAGERMCRSCRRLRRTRDCAVCGVQFQPNGPEQATCSHGCGQRRRLEVHGPATPRKPRQCEVCGSDYRRSYPGQRTCGRRCGWELRVREGKVPRPQTPKPRVAKTCPQCGGEFEGRGRYCSAPCAAAGKRAYDRAYSARRPKAYPPGKCRQCGRDITRGIKCADCLAATRIERKRRERRRRRVIRRGVATEPYTLAEIAERDRHRCQLCRRRVAMAKTVPHPKSPTIDHVLPLAAGGDDTRANVQLAHFECNVRKRDGGTQQLALVG